MGSIKGVFLVITLESCGNKGINAYCRFSALDWSGEP